jgi:hypothetical protein
MMSVIKDDRSDAPTRRLPWRFILLVGVTSLFADKTYEGARGVTGDFLGKLSASGAIVGFVAGGGELAACSRDFRLRMDSYAIAVDSE